MKYAGAVYEARTHGSVRGMRRARLTLLDVPGKKFLVNFLILRYLRAKSA